MLMRKLSLLILCQLCVVFTLVAQNRMISGTVNDQNGQPVANASVVVKGTTIGTVTNEAGAFTLSVPTSATTLVISSTGMTPVETDIAGRSEISVSMTMTASDLDEVIVVAYGTVKKGDFTGSANQVNYDDFKNRPILNPLNAIVATGPGVST